MKPMVIGVAGASCTGKSTLARHLARVFGQSTESLLDMDGYHKHTRKQRLSLDEYPDDLSANNLGELVAHLARLKAGGCVDIPRYNHKTGDFGGHHSVNPHHILIIEGLHAALINDLSRERLVDVAIFLDPTDDLRNAWKVRRDVTLRGYPYRQAVDQIGEREPHVRRVILPQRQKAEVRVAISATSVPGQNHYDVLVNRSFLTRRIRQSSVADILESYCTFQTGGSFDMHTGLCIASVNVPRLIADIERCHVISHKYAREWLCRHALTTHSRAKMLLRISALLWPVFIESRRR